MDAFFDENPSWLSGYVCYDGKPDGVVSAFFNRPIERKDFRSKIFISFASVFNFFAYGRSSFPPLFRSASANYVWDGGLSAVPYIFFIQNEFNWAVACWLGQKPDR